MNRPRSWALQGAHQTRDGSLGPRQLNWWCEVIGSGSEPTTVGTDGFTVRAA
jgi:hypothetical protein